MNPQDLAALRRLLPGDVLTAEADLAAYSYDAAPRRVRPEAVVLARCAEDVRQTVLFCRQRRLPYIARGAGTNLSGGCAAVRGGVVLSLARMNRILQVDTAAGFAVVEPGAINLRLQDELEKTGHYYAPDPASFRVSTIGGNIAENAGGPRCLKYGVTTNHVLALEAVMPDGSIERFSAEDPGCEIMSLLVGSEGTLGIVTQARVRILPLPALVHTVLAGFPSVESAVECVCAIIAAGIVPRALEAMDRATVESVEAYMRAGYPATEAVLIIEMDGSEEQVVREAQIVERLAREHGAAEVRSATAAGERDRLWEGRRGAYAACARLAPNVLVEDGVVPRDRLPEVVRRIREISARHGVKPALLFHAGDGNIHPNMPYDERDSSQTARVRAAGQEMLRACVELGGSLSGEHGIGTEKREAMRWLHAPRALKLFRDLKGSFDPEDLANPGKIIPDEAPADFAAPAVRALSAHGARLAEKVRQCAREGRPMAVRGSGSRWQAAPPGCEELLTTGMSGVLDWDKGNYTITVEAGIAARSLALELASQGFHARLLDGAGTLGGILATKPWTGLRDDVLGLRLLLADGEIVDLGGKVVKNVAGYDIPRLVLGSWGTLGIIMDVTLRLHSLPQAAVRASAPRPFRAGPWQKQVKAAFDPRNLLNPWFFGEPS
ncbi:MAG TPA: FAD-binding oxidoreductase [Elusimicrobia bacterium]|nr:FAD-binding oxidoreductase [Elusimicrobiota bacterium]HBT61347.1 FAD-binding oxidoreductase [Elusimicrobiota bacterium]